MILPSVHFVFALLWVAVPLSAQPLSAQDPVLSPSKGTDVLLPSEEAAWWATLSIQEKGKLSQLFHAPWFVTLQEKEKIAYCYVAQKVYDLLNSGADSNPDDSYRGFAPLLLRTSFHSSGSYHHGSGSGGSNGGTIFNQAELDDDMNGCIQTATDEINSRLNNSAIVSLADAVIIAGVVALDSMGFPRMDLIRVQGGRVDLEKLAYTQSMASPDNDPMMHFVTMYNLTVSELVAVIGGGHNFGSAHGMCSGYQGQWTTDPLSWSDPETGVPEFFVDLLKDDWLWRKVCTYKNGTVSYMSMEDPFSSDIPAVVEDTTPPSTCKTELSEDPLNCEAQAMRGCNFADGVYNTSDSPCDVKLLKMRLRSDFFLKANPMTRPHAEAFATDPDLLAQEFGVAYRKLTHNGLDRCGLSGRGCDGNTKCITYTDTVTDRYLSSSCVSDVGYNYAADEDSDYGSWSLDHGASIAVLFLLAITSILSIFLTFKAVRKYAKAPPDVGKEYTEPSSGDREIS
jgi:catalase (peroxidase I)